MISGKDASFKGADCYNGTLSRFPVDQTGGIIDCQVCDGGKTLPAAGFPDFKTNMLYNVAANAQNDYNQNSSSTDPLIDLFGAQSYASLIESSGLPFYRSQERSGDRELDTSPLNLWIPKEETLSCETFMNTDQTELEQSLQAVNMNNAHESQSNLKGETSTSYLASASVMRAPKKLKKRSEAESYCRSIVSRQVRVLHDDLPETLKDKRANQVSVLHNVIGHIKNLQLQLKELSKSRLASNSNSVPLKFVEGSGYCHPNADMFDEPLDEYLRSLFQEDPDAARKVFESYGLYTVPMASIYEFLGSKA